MKLSLSSVPVASPLRARLNYFASPFREFSNKVLYKLGSSEKDPNYRIRYSGQVLSVHDADHIYLSQWLEALGGRINFRDMKGRDFSINGIDGLDLPMFHDGKNFIAQYDANFDDFAIAFMRFLAKPDSLPHVLKLGMNSFWLLTFGVNPIHFFRACESALYPKGVNLIKTTNDGLEAIRALEEDNPDGKIIGTKFIMP